MPVCYSLERIHIALITPTKYSLHNYTSLCHSQQASFQARARFITSSDMLLSRSLAVEQLFNKKSTVFFSSPAMAQGVPYVTGFDSQIFLFAALLHLKPG